jgi:hypothetical protein
MDFAPLPKGRLPQAPRKGPRARASKHFDMRSDFGSPFTGVTIPPRYFAAPSVVMAWGAEITSMAEYTQELSETRESQNSNCHYREE